MTLEDLDEVPFVEDIDMSDLDWRSPHEEADIEIMGRDTFRYSVYHRTEKFLCVKFSECVENGIIDIRHITDYRPL